MVRCHDGSSRCCHTQDLFLILLLPVRGQYGVCTRAELILNASGRGGEIGTGIARQAHNLRKRSGRRRVALYQVIYHVALHLTARMLSHGLVSKSHIDASWMDKSRLRRSGGSALLTCSRSLATAQRCVLMVELRLTPHLISHRIAPNFAAPRLMLPLPLPIR